MSLAERPTTTCIADSTSDNDANVNASGARRLLKYGFVTSMVKSRTRQLKHFVVETAVLPSEGGRGAISRNGNDWTHRNLECLGNWR